MIPWAHPSPHPKWPRFSHFLHGSHAAAIGRILCNAQRCARLRPNNVVLMQGKHFYRAKVRYSAILAVVLCRSVCPSHAGIVSKQLNIGSRKQKHTIAQGLYFSHVKDIGEIRTVLPTNGGREMQVGKGKVGEFRHISREITTMQKRRLE